MQCGHCLRGKPQNKSMSRLHLHNFLSQISYISSVCFTGGEPTLPSGMKTIYDFMDICNQERVDVGSFYMVTNAKVWRDDLPPLIERLYNFCSDNEISCIDISCDQYHDRIQSRRISFKNELEYIMEYEYGITEIVSCRPEHINYESIIAEGRGVQYGSGKYFEAPEIRIEQWEDDGEYKITESDIYLNCDGNVINGCDWSYESQNDPDNIICAASDDFEKAVLKHHDTVCETV